MNKETHVKITALIVTIISIVLLFSQVDVGNFIDLLIKIKPKYLVIGFVFYVISYFFRALRFYILLKKDVRIKDLFSIVCVHNMAVNIFPVRSGEISYIYLLTKRHNKTIGESAATLIIVRMLDIVGISILFFVSLMLSHNLPEIITKATPIVSILVMLIVSVLFILLYHYNRFVAWLGNVSVYLKLNKNHLVGYMLVKMNEMADSFNSINQYYFTTSILISIIIWVILYFVNYIIIIGMGIELAFGAFLLALTFFVITTMIPVQGIGGFGTFEAGWAISFIAVGIQKEVAISSGFMVHIIAICYVLILSLFGFIGLPKILNEI